MADNAALAPFLDVFPEWLRTLGDDARELGESVGEADRATARYTVGGLNYIFKSLDLIPDGIDDLGFCDDAFVIRVAAKLALTAPAEVSSPSLDAAPSSPAVEAEASSPAVEAEASSPAVEAEASSPAVEAEASSPAVDAAPAEDVGDGENEEQATGDGRPGEDESSAAAAEAEAPADEAPADAAAEASAEEAVAPPSAVLSRLASEADQVEAFLGDDYALLVTYVHGLRKGAARGRTVDVILGDEGLRESFLQEVKAWATDYQVPAFTRDVKTLIKLKAFLSAKLG